MPNRYTDRLRWGLTDNDVRDLRNKYNNTTLPLEDEKSFNQAVSDAIKSSDSRKAATSIAEVEERLRLRRLDLINELDSRFDQAAYRYVLKVDELGGAWRRVIAFTRSKSYNDLVNLMMYSVKGIYPKKWTLVDLDKRDSPSRMECLDDTPPPTTQPANDQQAEYSDHSLSDFLDAMTSDQGHAERSVPPVKKTKIKKNKHVDRILHKTKHDSKIKKSTDTKRKGTRRTERLQTK